ncbi:hypothetical protein JW758_02150 [Candidatus Peregrinibacteria bacterium]|nr:hypothetical protein [Candidatus Peregrinibacteria bacterium]
MRMEVTEEEEQRMIKEGERHPPILIIGTIMAFIAFIVGIVALIMHASM